MVGIGVGIGIDPTAAGAAANDNFEFTVKTDNVGTSSDTSFTLPLPSTGTFNFDIDWGDGNSETVVTNTPKTHDYGVGNEGTYTISIGGTNNTFPHMKFDNGADKLKFLDISNWGDIAWGTWESVWYGCTNLTVSATDTPVTSGVTLCKETFMNCDLLTELPALDMSANTSFQKFCDGCNILTTVGELTTTSALLYCTNMYDDCVLLTSPGTEDMETSGLISTPNMFLNCAALDTDVSGWNIVSLANALGMFNGSGFSQTNYDLMLVAWEGQTHNSGLSFHAGTATYGAGAPATARAALVSDTWSITDGGPA